MEYSEMLEVLCKLNDQRVELVSSLFEIREKLISDESAAIKKELKLRESFEEIIQKATPEDIKVKYSNESKRKIAYDIFVNSNEDLSIIRETINNNKYLERSLICDEQILKIREKYLFKKIDLIIACKL